MSLGDAVKTYTILTVGDGLVTLIPSLLVSVAGGIVLTRANSSGMLAARYGSNYWRGRRPSISPAASWRRSA